MPARTSGRHRPRRLPAIAAALALAPLAAPARPDVTVEFEHDGRSWSIEGKRTAPRTYLFNEGADERVRIVTLNWAPYIGEHICNQGWVQQVTVALFATRGYEVESEFYPWARAVMKAESGDADILYPEYFIEPEASSSWYEGTKRRDHLALSRKIPGGPIAFMKRKGDGDYYRGDLEALEGERIGVVRGYQNTPSFDRLMDQGFFDVEKVKNDVLNAGKLANERVNLIVGDPAVIQFSVSDSDMDPAERRRTLEQLTVEQPFLQYNHLYYAVSRNSDGWRKTRRDVSAAIEEFLEQGTMVRLIRRSNEECGLDMEATLEPYLDG